MKYFSIILIMATTLSVTAQSKLTETNQSSITGISLPTGSKQDKRALYVSVAKMVLEPVGKKHNTAIKNTEVLYLQPLNGNRLNIETIKPLLQEKGWTVSTVDGEPEYLWLEQNGKYVLAFISNDKKGTNVYFAETNTVPSIGTITTQQPTSTPVTQQTSQQQKPQQVYQPTQTTVTVSNGFTYNSTNFDDGWVSEVKEDWVKVSKPGIKILIHYPNQKADAYNSNKLEGDYNAWTILVAHRYSNITNLLDRGIQDYQSITFLTANAVDANGKQVHVVLYKKKYDTGVGRYMEIVADDQQTFEREFGNNYINRSDWSYMDQVKSWDKLAAMQWRNKFAIGANDLTGTWKSSTYASLSYYYVNGGGFAGATATSIADEFTFSGDGKYQSDHAGASGVVGNQKFSREVFKGNATTTDWTITLTNRFQHQTETYNCYFEAVKGGRLLMMTDRLGTTLTLAKSQ